MGREIGGRADPPCSCGETSPVMWIFDIPCALNPASLNGVTNQIQLAFSVTLILRFMFVTSSGLKRLRVRPQSRWPRYYLKYTLLTENRHHI